MNNKNSDMVIDFDDAQAVNGWQAIDDRIMGGISQSRAEHIENVGLRFSGTVSFANNGGFASIRSGPGKWSIDQYRGLKLKLRGDGKSYKLSLRTDIYFDGISYQTSFATRKDTWLEVSLPFNSFIPTHHGVMLRTVAALDASDIRSFGFFIADRQEGDFQLDVAWIKGDF